MKFLQSVLLGLLSLSSALAQSPRTTPTPYIDPNPYQSQTWLRYQDQRILTLSALPGKNTFAFEQANALPPVYATGANYGIFRHPNGYVIAVVDAHGRFYQYGKTVEPKTAGGVFFTEKGSNLLTVIDSQGAPLTTTLTAPDIKIVGGNYFFDSQNVLTTMKSMGQEPWNWAGMVTRKEGMTLPPVLTPGGNFYVDLNQKITTISSENGYFSDPQALPSGAIAKVVGGNWFITQDQRLFTVSNTGDLRFIRKLEKAPTVRGYSYLIFADASLISIHGDGAISETLVMTSMDGETVDTKTLLPTSIQSNIVFQGGRQ